MPPQLYRLNIRWSPPQFIPPAQLMTHLPCHAPLLHQVALHLKVGFAAFNSTYLEPNLRNGNSMGRLPSGSSYPPLTAALGGHPRSSQDYNMSKPDCGSDQILCNKYGMEENLILVHPHTEQTAREKTFSEFSKPRPAKSTGGTLTSVSSPAQTFTRWRKRSSAENPSSQKHSSNENDMTRLKFLALNALDLTAPASDVLLKNRQNKWFQLSGHPDCFAPAGPGTIWKKRSGTDNSERAVYEALSTDPVLRDLVPRYFREVEYQGEKFIELQDLLHGFSDPSVMDVKLGTRTFLESEVQKTTARHDLYLKMVAVDPNAPTEEEHNSQAVTKLRYMQFREQQSSTCSQGFRIEAMKLRGSPPVTNLKKVKSRKEVLFTLSLFLAGREDARQRFLTRLNEIRIKLEESAYFKTHEVVGSSLFMIYDDQNVGVWLIDFAKTYSVPPGVVVNHRRPWVQGNHEEGLLFGLDQLISVLEEVDCKRTDLINQSMSNHSDSKS